jgi:hypothetical protein
MPSSILYSDLSCDLTSIEYVEGIPMAGKRSPTKRNAVPPRIDNLKLINGIGPEVEKRLNGRGIFSFAQLANLPPTDVAAAVAGLIGLSTEHIIKQDWIGQARKLAAEKTLSEAQKDAKPAAESQAPIEHTHASTPLVEPQQASKLTSESTSSEAQAPALLEHTHSAIPSVESHNTTTEPTSNEAQEEVEAPANSEQTPPIELTHAVTTLKEPQKDSESIASTEQLHPATFTIELLLDENNYVHIARVTHVENQREHTWSGWPNTELVDFLSKSVELNIPSDEPALPIAEEHVHPKEPNHTPVEPTLPIAEEHVHHEEPVHAPMVVAESKPLIVPEAEPMFTGQLHVREMEIVGVASSDHLKILARDTPFDVRLTLDFSELQGPHNTPLNYSASIYGKSNRSGLVLGQIQGTLVPSDTATIKLEGNILSEEGIYHLAAQVIVGLPTMKLRLRPGTTALIDGGQIQVL